MARPSVASASVRRDVEARSQHGLVGARAASSALAPRTSRRVRARSACRTRPDRADRSDRTTRSRGSPRRASRGTPARRRCSTSTMRSRSQLDCVAAIGSVVFFVVELAGQGIDVDVVAAGHRASDGLRKVRVGPEQLPAVGDRRGPPCAPRARRAESEPDRDSASSVRFSRRRSIISSAMPASFSPVRTVAGSACCPDSRPGTGLPRDPSS